MIHNLLEKTFVSTILKILSRVLTFHSSFPHYLVFLNLSQPYASEFQINFAGL